MKKYIHIILLCLFFSKAHSQDIKKDTFGLWGYIDVVNPQLSYFDKYHVKGIHFIAQWKDIRPSYNGAYNWDTLTARLDSCIARDIYCGIQINVGQNSPQWVFDSVGSFMTVGHPTQHGPWPKYYDERYKRYYYTLLKDVASFMASLSPERLHRIIYWQIAEGSTGDGQPYKGALDSCQADETCTLEDSLSNPLLGDPLVPQTQQEFKWEEFRRSAWDTIALSSAYHLIDSVVALMINTGNSANDYTFVLDTVIDDPYFDEGYILTHFANLPLQPYSKGPLLGQHYGIRSEKALFKRPNVNDRCEIQGYIKGTQHPHKDLFTLFCSALTAGLDIANADFGYGTMNETYEQYTDPRMGDFFTLMTNSNSDGFVMPAFKVDYGDTVLYKSRDYGQLINPDPLLFNRYKERLTALKAQSDMYGSGIDYDVWKYWQAVNKFINPERADNIDELYPNAQFGNFNDSMWQNDHVLYAEYSYHKNLRFINDSSSVIPEFRVGPDTSLYGRYAGRPKLDNNGKCKWKFDVDDKIIKNMYGDTLKITVIYLANGTGGSFTIGWDNCGEKQHSNKVVVNTSTGLFKEAEFILPNFRFKEDGYDFSIDFNGDATIAFIQVKVY